MTVLTAAEERVLRFLHEWPGWHSRLELRLIRLLETGDADAAVPGLADKGLVRYMVEIDAVKLTAAGETYGDRLAGSAL